MQPAQRILLVEDDPDEAQRARDALAESGYVVLVAASAQKAREAAAEEEPFDLVFMDLRLPDGDGLRLVPALRRAGVRAPVVLVTGDSSERVGEAAFRAGCVDLAVKDLNYHLWLPRMAQALIPSSAAGFGAWAPHVLGLCVGRLQPQTMRAEPADLWPPLAGALQAATELAIKGVRAAGHSLLGSLPMVHLQLRDRSLVFVLRGGVFGAALLARPPDEDDEDELLSAVTAYAHARTPMGENEA
jgi:CheY-like chemotaxis protein